MKKKIKKKKKNVEAMGEVWGPCPGKELHLRDTEGHYR